MKPGTELEMRRADGRHVRGQALVGSLYCAVGQDILLSRCLSPPKRINECSENVKES